MEIKIKSIGTKKGTVGWLKAGILSGAIYFREAATKKGNRPGLKIYTPEITDGMWVALKNPHNLSDSDLVSGYDNIALVTSDGGGWCGGDEIGCTDACWSAIKRVALAWKERIEAQESAEKEPRITVIFEEA